MISGPFFALSGEIVDFTSDGLVVCVVDNHNPIPAHHAIYRLKLKPHEIELVERKDLWEPLINNN